MELIREIGRTGGTVSMIRVRRRDEEPAGDGPVGGLDIAGRSVSIYRADAAEIPDAFGPGGPAAFIERDESGVETVVARRVPPQASGGVGAGGTREFQGGRFG